MINQHFYIARLIARYLSDEIEEEEQAELIGGEMNRPKTNAFFGKSARKRT